MFSVRERTVRDRGLVGLWWTHYDLPCPQEGLLPDNTTWICEFDGEPIVQCSLYITNSEVAWIECLIGNPAAPKAVRRLATKFIVSHIKEFAKESGYVRLFCMAPNEKLKSYYEKLGFETTGQAYTLTREI